MPAEWTPHARCWMAWPCHEPTFLDLPAGRSAFAEVARTIARFEPVTMIANPEHVDDAREQCGETVDVLPLEIDDSWARDTGPTYLVDDRRNLAAVDWLFNNYGELDPDYENDKLIARRLIEQSRARRFEAPIFLEGGAIHTDGQGTLLTTESVVLNPNRNPGLTKKDAEAVFRAYLGADQVVWLDKALDIDTTGGHVDNLACFIRPGVVAALATSDPEDSQYEPLRENLRRLESAQDAAGRSLEIIEIEQPARQEFGGNRVCASYINFYIANSAIVLPVFGDPADRLAVETLERAFPDRLVAPVPGLDIVRAGGCVHCITQQQPAA